MPMAQVVFEFFRIWTWVKKMLSGKQSGKQIDVSAKSPRQ
jgi:hypothetical protein